MILHELKYRDLTERIIGCAMKVHRHFGPGFPDIVYKRALMIELQKIGLKCKQEVELDIFYENTYIYKRRFDLIVEEVVLLELKAQKEVDKADHCQITNYLRVFNIEIGLLLNFGAPNLQFKRFVQTVKYP